MAPSIVEPGEVFEVAVRSEDMYKNPVSGRSPAYRVTLDGETIAKLPRSREPVSVIPDLELWRARRLPVRGALGGRASPGRSNPVWVRQKPHRTGCTGATPTPTPGCADGMGTPDALYRLLGTSPGWTSSPTPSTTYGPTPTSGGRCRPRSHEYTAPGSFTPILGYEFTAQLPNGGHNNVYFRTAEGRQPVTNQFVVGKQQLYLKLREVHDPRDVVIIPHAHAPGDWRLNDPVMERVVEMQSGHGTFEWYGNRFLEQGWKVGFIGSSDNHAGHGGYSPGTNRQLGGLAAVLAPQNARRRSSTGSGNGPATPPRGSASSSTSPSTIRTWGGIRADAVERRVRCRVMGTEPIEAIDLIKNGQVVYSKRYLEGRISRGHVSR